MTSSERENTLLAWKSNEWEKKVVAWRIERGNC